MPKVDYLQFKGIFDAGEYNDFAIFKDGYNVAFDIENRISLPPEFEKVRSYDVQVLKYEKLKTPKFWGGKEVDLCLGYKEGKYYLFLNDEKIEFSTRYLASARTITGGRNPSIDVFHISNESKLFIQNPSQEFLSVIENLRMQKGYFYVYWDNWDRYLNKFFICDNFGYEEEEGLLHLTLRGQKIFRRYNSNLTSGMPETSNGYYNKPVYVLDCNLLGYVNKDFHNEIVDYKVYAFADGISIHKIWGNVEIGEVGNLIYYDKNTNYIFQKRGIYNFNPNLSNWDDMDSSNPYVFVNISNYEKRTSSYLSNRNFLYAYAFTAVLTNGEEIPLLVGMRYQGLDTNYYVKLAPKVFFLDLQNPIYQNHHPLLFSVRSISYEYLPLMIERINIYVAEVDNFSNYYVYENGAWYLYYNGAQNVPDSLFVLRGYIDLKNNNSINRVESDITLAELPTMGSKWLVKLRDEVVYGSDLVIGVGEKNLIYENATLAEGSMIDIIPEENFTSLSIIGNIEKIEVWEYKLFAFTNEQLYVLDPERNYQIINKFDIGLIDRRGITTTPYGIVFVSSTGNVYLTDGVKLEELSVNFREKLRRYIKFLIFVAYNGARNEILLNCGRVIYVYHFLINKWSIYATKEIFVSYSQFKELYLLNVKGEVVRLNYNVRTNNKEKVILITYKNDFGIKGAKILKSITLDCLGIINVVLITDRFVKAYKFKYPHMKIAMPSVLFNYLQLAFWSDDYRFDIKRIEVEFEEARVDYEKSLKPVSLDGFVLDCNNEFAGLSKNNVVRYSHPDAVYELNDIDASCVYDSVFKGYKKGGQEVLDFDYLYEYLNQLNVKKVIVNTRVFWTSFNSRNSTDDEDFNPNTAKIYNNPVLPYINDGNRMLYIFPAVSFKFRQYGRGGSVNKWSFKQHDELGNRIYELNEKLDKCYWVFYNGSRYARNNIGQWVNFNRYDSYSSLQSSEELGWYYDKDTQTLYIKLASNINPDMENISIVIDNPLDWKARDDSFWDFNQNRVKHFRIPHPWVSGTIDDDVLVKILKMLKEKGYKVGFHSELVVLNSIGIGHRKYINFWDSKVAGDYTNWIRHYVKLFKDNNVKVDLFWVGSEMTKLEQTMDFSVLISNIIEYVKGNMPETKVVYSINNETLNGLINHPENWEEFVVRVIRNRNLDYIGVHFYPPLLLSNQGYVYNPHLYLSNLDDKLGILKNNTNKKLIVVFGVRSINRSLYDTSSSYPSGSDGSVDEVAQFCGIYALLRYLSELKERGIVEDYYLNKIDVRPFPAYPDAFEFKGKYDYYYNDNTEYAVNEHFINKLLWYLIRDV